MNHPTCKSTAKRLAVQRKPLNAKRALPPPTEHEEQAALIRWATANTPRVPALALLLAIPNGGARHPVVASKLKAEGVKPGVPDLFLAEGREVGHDWCNGLWIEMKRRNAVPSDVKADQQDWHDRLRRANYAVVVCKGWEEARNAICQYLGVTP